MKGTSRKANGKADVVDTHVYLPRDMLEQLKQEAKRTERTLQTTLRIIIRQYFESR